MNRQDIKNKLQESMVAVNPKLAGVPLDDATSLADLGLNSLKLIELGVRLEDSFGNEIGFDNWIEQERGKSGVAFQVGSLVSFLAERSAS